MTAVEAKTESSENHKTKPEQKQAEPVYTPENAPLVKSLGQPTDDARSNLQRAGFPAGCCDGQSFRFGNEGGTATVAAAEAKTSTDNRADGRTQSTAVSNSHEIKRDQETGGTIETQYDAATGKTTETRDDGHGHRFSIETSRDKDGNTVTDKTGYFNGEIRFTYHEDAKVWNSSERHANGSATVKEYDKEAGKTTTHLLDKDGNLVPRTEGELLKGLDGQMKAAEKNDEFSGTVAVAKDGKIIFEGSYGKADRDKNTPNENDTKYPICSLGKMLTATAIMQLVEQHKLDLDDKLGDLLPQYYGGKGAVSDIKLRELLSHTSGLRDVFPSLSDADLKKAFPNDDPQKVRADIAGLKSEEDYARYFSSHGDGKGTPNGDPHAKPEQGKYSYSNYGFMLLGAIVDRLAKTDKTADYSDYYDYVNKHILKPAGMTNTGFDTDGRPVDKRATGTQLDADGHWKSITDSSLYRSSPAGNAYSTVGDMVKFADALLNKNGSKLFKNPNTAREMMQGRVDTEPSTKYGYGFHDLEENGVHGYGHHGGAPGLNTEFKYYPETGYTAVVFSNMTHAARQALDYILSRLPTQ